MSTLIHWFRRDLRVTDNSALFHAARDADRVVPVFLLDDHYGNDPNVGPARFRFLGESLEALERSLTALGGRLIVRPGPARETLPRLLAETGAGGVYANLDIGPYPEKRDAQARESVVAAGAAFRLFADALLVEPDAVTTDAGDPYTVFTPFWKKWQAVEKHPPLAAPAALLTPDLATVPLDRVRSFRGLPAQPEAPRGGEPEGRRLLDRFLDGPLARYAENRDRADREGTSRLSPHLHFGTLSPRTLLAEVLAKRRALPPPSRRCADAFVRELAWREFFHHLLFHFPRVATESFRGEFDRLPWRSNTSLLEAWKSGRTGYPFIDATMRQLSAAHWIHNRGRMAVASFLTKDLHFDWRVGEKWFERQLADADLANNNGGWQWAAGSGADAAPYFRIFNPVLQGKKADPAGAYVRRWAPELSRVPAAKIHEPWTMTSEEQRESRCRIGTDYPAPIVDHGNERQTALEMFETIRKSDPRGRIRF